VAIVDIRVLAGERFNNLEAGTVSISSTDSVGTYTAPAVADPSFPVSNLYDGRPSRSFRPLVAPVFPFGLGLAVDGNALTNGALETWSGGLLANWTRTGTGNVTQTSAAGEFVTGSAAKFSGGSSPAIYQDFVVRSGQARCLTFWLKAVVMTATLQNLQTGKTLSAAGTWGSLQTVGTGLAAYSQFTVNYTVEPFSTTQAPLVTLRLTITGSPAGTTGFADEIADYPAVDFVSVHGHNLDQHVSLQLKSCDEPLFGISAAVQATMTPLQPSCYSILPAKIYKRYWQLTLLPGNSPAIAVPEIGELVIGQAYALAQAPTYGAELGFIRDDVATETGLGEAHVYGRGTQPRRTLGLKFRFDSETKYRDARDEIFRRCGGRVNPLVIVPDTTLPDVIYGRIDRSWKVTRSLVSYYDQNDLSVAESAFPIPTN
jgi:hypothetical protein